MALRPVHALYDKLRAAVLDLAALMTGVKCDKGSTRSDTGTDKRGTVFEGNAPWALKPRHEAVRRKRSGAGSPILRHAPSAVIARGAEVMLMRVRQL